MTTEKIKIVEVGPRDGLQNEAKTLLVEDRIELITQLAGAGLGFIEGGSFVSPKAIPQMVDSEKVFEGTEFLAADISFLVPNIKGFDRAVAVGVKSLAIFSATSDSFTQKNIQRSVSESLMEFEEVCRRALDQSLKVRGYISTAFGCPYEGYQNPKRLLEICERLFKMGCFEVSIGDTIGVAHPRQIRDVFSQLAKQFDIKKIAAHLHDTRGAALTNILTAVEAGVRVVDASVGGLGGCPYATGSSGNVATEEVVWLLEGEGFQTGVKLTKLLETCAWTESKIGRKLKSKFYLSTPRKMYYDEL